MSVDNISVDSGSGPGALALSVAEEAFFSSGGEAEIPREEGDGAAGGDSAGANAGDGKGADGKPLVAAGDGKQPQHVPLAALHEERGKRKGLEKEARELREKLANFEGRFAVLDRLAPKKEGEGAAEQPAGRIEPETDVFGAVRQVGETLDQMQKRLDDADAVTKASNEQRVFVDNYRADAGAFEAKTPDYRAAYNHLLNTRADELIAIGFDDPKALQDAGADPAEVHAAAKALHDALVADEFAIADRAFKAKKSPAEIIYNLAKKRGYAVKAAGAGDGKQPGTEKLEQIERGQQANKSLNNAGGGGGDGDMTAERLLAMPMSEYEVWVEKNPAKARAIMGG